MAARTDEGVHEVAGPVDVLRSCHTDEMGKEHQADHL
jgi:hypothetical protein